MHIHLMLGVCRKKNCIFVFFIAFASSIDSCVKTFHLSNGWAEDFLLLYRSPVVLEISLEIHSSFVSAAMIQGPGQGLNSTFIPRVD